MRLVAGQSRSVFIPGRMIWSINCQSGSDR